MKLPNSVAIIGTRGYPSFYGGFETAVRRLAPYLADAGWDVTVYGRPNGVNTRTESADPRIRSKITRGLETKSFSTLTYGFTSVVDAIRNKPDVVLVMNVANGFWIPFLRMARIPSLVNVDGIEWDRAKWSGLAKIVFKVGAWLTARYADELVMDARAIDERWKATFNRGGVFIPYGGDPQPDSQSPLGLRRRSFALMVARFVPENSIQEFFDAVPEIARNFPVVIVGSSGYGGEFDATAARLASEHDNVVWLGHVSDDRLLHALWQNCGAYFHGHSVGGTNPALVQAMACGAPVIARSTVYNREVLGTDSWFVEPDPGQISMAVCDMLSDSNAQERSSSRNAERAGEEYSWEEICERYLRTLQHLMRK